MTSLSSTHLESDDDTFLTNHLGTYTLLGVKPYGEYPEPNNSILVMPKT